MEVDAWQDPDFLESLRKHATKVSIPDGGIQTATLRVVDFSSF